MLCIAFRRDPHACLLQDHWHKTNQTKREGVWNRTLWMKRRDVSLEMMPVALLLGQRSWRKSASLVTRFQRWTCMACGFQTVPCKSSNVFFCNMFHHIWELAANSGHFIAVRKPVSGLTHEHDISAVLDNYNDSRDHRQLDPLSESSFQNIQRKQNIRNQDVQDLIVFCISRRSSDKECSCC